MFTCVVYLLTCIHTTFVSTHMNTLDLNVLSCLILTSQHLIYFAAFFSEICDLIHSVGGQVYLDGANMNAQVIAISVNDIVWV